MQRTTTALLCALLATVAPCAAAGEVKVAVAANFAGTLAQLAPGFRASTGHEIKVSAGATGKLYAQVLAGAPFEVLIAADEETPRRLVEQGHALAGSQFTYAQGRLVLWSAQPGLVDERGAVLMAGRFAHLAIANPRTAPYGAAAMQALNALGLAAALQLKLVTGESIAQAFQFVSTGNAELGLVALSQVAPAGKPATGSAWIVPASLHAPIRQDAVLLKAGMANPAAQALLEYLKSPAARVTIRSHGYEVERQ
jgi:molybdate transport system substrate-binding protein